MGTANRRSGVSLVEVLVATAIVATMIGLLLPAVQQVREAGIRAQSMNTLRQMSIPMHQFADVHNGRLPHIWGSSREFWPTPHMAAALHWDVPLGQAPRFLNWPVRQFISPADPSATAEDLRDGTATSYAANAQVFTRRMRLPPSIPDGLSQTIFFAEHYARCSANSPFEYNWYFAPGKAPVFAAGGPKFQPYGGYHVFPITSGYPPVTRPSRDGATFQVRPRLLSENRPAIESECDPTLPQTPHPGGMLIAFGDGSVRTANPRIAPEVFWAAVTPDAGEVLSDDW